MDRIALTEAIARRWNEAAVVYAVAHGIDEWPGRLGRDLDVVIAAPDVARAITIARDVLQSHGLAVVSPPPLWGERLVAAERDAPDDLLEIHTTPRITWRNTAIVERPEPAGRVGPFAIDPWIAVAKRVVLPLLAGRTGLLRDDPLRTALGDTERAAATRHLVGLAGATLTARLLAALDARDLDALDALTRHFRGAVFRRSATRHPARAAALLWHSVARRLREPLTPCAPVVAVVGALGGESDADAGALVRRIADGDRLVFTDLVVRSRDAGSTALGRLLRDRIDSSRQRLVLYDGRPGGGAPNGRAGMHPLRRLLHPDPDLTIVVGDGGGQDAAWSADHPRHAGGAIAILPPNESGDELRRRAVALIIGAFMSKNGGAPLPETG